MAQQRYPQNTTSISGIVEKDWDDFHARAERECITRKEALERAVSDLVLAVHRNDAITWRPAMRPSKPRPVKIHDDSLTQVHELSQKFGYRNNVIISTAIHRWTVRP